MLNYYELEANKIVIMHSLFIGRSNFWLWLSVQVIDLLLYIFYGVLE